MPQMVLFDGAWLQKRYLKFKQCPHFFRLNLCINFSLCCSSVAQALNYRQNSEINVFYWLSELQGGHGTFENVFNYYTWFLQFAFIYNLH